VQHFGTRCYAWDVLNEALNDNGTLRQDIWLNTIGPAYIPLVFQFAEEALKGVRGGRHIRFYYNDYGIENPGLKSAAALQLVKSVKDRGIKIDGVGLQSHFVVGGTPSRETQVQNLRSFTASGFDVALTELDVRFSNVSDLSIGGGLEQQSRDYRNSVAACVDVKRCVGVTVWDFDDRYSWIPGTFPGQGFGDIWWANLTAKPAYDGVVAGLMRRGWK